MKIVWPDPTAAWHLKLPPTPSGEDDANAVILDRWLEAGDLKAKGCREHGLSPISISTPGTFQGEEIVQMFWGREDVGLGELRKKTVVFIFSNSRGATLIAPPTVSLSTSPRELSKFFLQIVSIPDTEVISAPKDPPGSSFRTFLADKLSKVLAYFSGSHKQSSDLASEFQGSGEFEHDVVGLRLPRKRTLRSLYISVSIKELPRRKPHVFSDTDRG